MLAGIGAGLVIRSAPRILPAGQEGRVAWAAIVLPAAGPVVIALAVEWSPWWSWQGGFLFEFVLAMLSLALMLSIADPPDLDRDFPQGPVERLGYLPAAVVAALSVWYVMHWGQLHGWLEGPDITAAMIVGSIALSVLLWIVWPGVDPGTLREGLPRLGLITYGGFVQYFNSLDMGVYGGLLVNFSPWMRSWLIWSLTLGSTAALALGRIVWQKRSPGFAGAALGLLVLAGGMSLSHYNTMNWPFWSLLNTVEFNWFAAPQHWQLAPPRFLMGFGSGMVLLAMTTCTSPDPLREARIRPFLQVAQFAGGTLSVGVLVTCSPSRASAPVFLRRRPGFHPGGRARRPKLTARRPRGHGRRARRPEGVLPDIQAHDRIMAFHHRAVLIGGGNNLDALAALDQPGPAGAETSGGRGGELFLETCRSCRTWS